MTAGLVERLQYLRTVRRVKNGKFSAPLISREALNLTYVIATATIREDPISSRYARVVMDIIFETSWNTVHVYK